MQTQLSPPSELASRFDQQLPLEIQVPLSQKISTDEYLLLANTSRNFRNNIARELVFRQMLERLQVIKDRPNRTTAPLGFQLVEDILDQAVYDMSDVYGLILHFTSIATLDDLLAYVREVVNRSSIISPGVYEELWRFSSLVFSKLLELDRYDDAMKIFNTKVLNHSGLMLLITKGLFNLSNPLDFYRRFFSKTSEYAKSREYLEDFSNILACATFDIAETLLIGLSGGGEISQEKLESSDLFQGNVNVYYEFIKNIWNKDTFVYLCGLFGDEITTSMIKDKIMQLTKMSYDDVKFLRIMSRMDNNLQWLISFYVKERGGRFSRQELDDLYTNADPLFFGNLNIFGPSYASAHATVMDSSLEQVMEKLIRRGDLSNLLGERSSYSRREFLGEFFKLQPCIVYFEMFKVFSYIRELSLVLDYYQSPAITILGYTKLLNKPNGAEYLIGKFSPLAPGRPTFLEFFYPDFFVVNKDKENFKILVNHIRARTTLGKVYAKPISPSLKSDDPEMNQLIDVYNSLVSNVDKLAYEEAYEEINRDPFLAILKYTPRAISNSTDPSVGMATLIRLGLTNFLQRIRDETNRTWPAWMFRTAVCSSAASTEWFLQELVKNPLSWNTQIDIKFLRRAQSDVQEVLRKYGIKF